MSIHCSAKWNVPLDKCEKTNTAFVILKNQWWRQQPSLELRETAFVIRPKRWSQINRRSGIANNVYHSEGRHQRCTLDRFDSYFICYHLLSYSSTIIFCCLLGSMFYQLQYSSLSYRFSSLVCLDESLLSALDVQSMECRDPSEPCSFAR
jgi:hypothetical protein